MFSILLNDKTKPPINHQTCVKSSPFFGIFLLIGDWWNRYKSKMNKTHVILGGGMGNNHVIFLWWKILFPGHSFFLIKIKNPIYVKIHFIWVMEKRIFKLEVFNDIFILAVWIMVICCYNCGHFLMSTRNSNVKLKYLS